MAGFDHRAFKSGIAVGLALKGSYAGKIDTKVNAAFTKGVEVGRRLKYSAPSAPVDGLISSDGYVLTDSNGILLIAKGGE